MKVSSVYDRTKLILKFGGSSVGTPEAIRAVSALVQPLRPRIGAVVVSAFAGVTDSLSILAALEPEARGEALIEQLSDRHRSVFAALLPDHEPSDELNGLLRDLRRAALSPVNLEHRDLLLSFGERLAATIVAYYLNAIGIRARYLDARKLILTDSYFGRASVDTGESYRRIRSALSFEPALGIVTGFIGSDAAGRTTTLGRGGSDLSATLIGAAIGADEIQIWTDVSGVYSEDPRLSPGAALLENLNYEEALSRALAGAKVLCPASIAPAKERGIPIRIKNTFRPDDPGTLISERPAAASGDLFQRARSSGGGIDLKEL